MLEKIICATDFTEPSAVAVRYAASLARATRASLDLIHAWDFVSELPADDRASMRQTVIAGSRDACRARLDDVARGLAVPGVKASAALIEGVPEAAIPEYATNRGADVLVVGTHASSGLAHALLGSVAERVLRTSSVPVLVVPANVSVSETATFSPKQILVPTDLTPGSGEALRFAIQLAAGARVATLHVWDVPPYFFEGGEAIKATEKRVPEHVEEWMDEVFDEEEPSVESIVRRGEPSEVLAAVCAERDPDLIVMATAGRAGIAHFMLGSVTERAVRTLGRPVLTLRREP